MNQLTSSLEPATAPGPSYIPFGDISTKLVLDEDGLRGGLAGGPNDHLSTSSTHQGRLPYHHGVHGPSETSPFSWSMDGLPRLSSGQQSVHYRITDGGWTLLARTTSGESVWHLALTDLARGTYRFTLLRPLDHPVTNAEDDLAFSIPYVIEDSQGNQATSRLGVTIDDDSPANGIDAPVTVDAGDHITGFWYQQPGGDGHRQTQVQISDQNATRHPLDAPIDTSVGTLTVHAEGTWRFHADGSPTDTRLDFAIITTDGDGDTITSQGRIEIKGPTDTTGPSTPETDADPDTGPAKAVVDEDGLAGGVDGGLNDAPRVSAMTTGTLNYSPGSGGLASFHWHTDRLPSLVSQGQILDWRLNDNGRLLEGTTAPDHQPVISIQLSQADRGGITVALFRPLDHDNPRVEDDISLTLGYTLHDRQGRSATGFLNIVIDDDRPDLRDDQAAMRQGQTLVTNVLANDALGADGGRLSEVRVRGGSEVGQVDIEPGGNVTFLPRDGFLGTADIVYSVVDGDGDVVDALLSVQVEPSRPLTATDLFDTSAYLAKQDGASDPLTASAPGLDAIAAIVQRSDIDLETLREASAIAML